MRYLWLSGTVVVLLNGFGATQGVAQSYPECPPPASDEYLLLIRGDDEAIRDRTLSVLPADQPTIVCSYLDDTVVRAGGFKSLEVANSWALYLNDIEQLDTVVVESAPPALNPPVAEAPPVPAPIAEEPPPVIAEPVIEEAPPEILATATTPKQYAPALLGDGVAVLVDYQQDPSIGRQLLTQQGNVGLAVYLQQPYLLILHTDDASLAATRLQQLVDSGLTSFLVDGNQVIRLTETIQ